jgi:lipid II:glycine glycyltransferase (peptidoglycan interpeptide bridge formation enzyme)
MKALSPGVAVEIDQAGKAEWHDLIQQFEDASIYQTWSYGELSWGKKNLSHLVLRKDGKIIAATQVRIARLAGVGPGMAYVMSGPLWRCRDGEQCPDHFRQAVRALYNEYAGRRKLMLRIRPHELEESQAEGGPLRTVLEDEGVKWRRTRYRTIILDLSPSLEELHKRLASDWRRNLKHAINNNLEIVKGSGDDLYGMFLGLYREMLARKSFTPGVDVDVFREVQKDLPESLKMRIWIAKFEGKPVSSLLFSRIGNWGECIMGGSSDTGLKLRATYLLMWKTLESLKAHGLRYCDLGGINPEQNPSVYQFKSGLRGKEVHELGHFEACMSPLSALTVRVGEGARAGAGALRQALANWRSARERDPAAQGH